MVFDFKVKKQWSRYMLYIKGFVGNDAAHQLNQLKKLLLS